jgi:hypothetical protein
MGQTKNVLKRLDKNLKKRYNFEDLDVDGGTILNTVACRPVAGQ